MKSYGLSDSLDKLSLTKGDVGVPLRDLHTEDFLIDIFNVKLSPPSLFFIGPYYSWDVSVIMQAH